MIKKLLVTGCSIACGFDTFDTFRTYHNVRNAYGQHIADTLNLTHENIALPGIDNRHIAQHTVQYLADKDASEYCVLVGWTSLHRHSFYYKNQFYVWTTNGYPEFCYPYDSDPALENAKEKFANWDNAMDLDNERYNWYHDIMYLNSYFEQHKIPFLMINTIQPFESINIDCCDLVKLESNDLINDIRSIDTYYMADNPEGTMWHILTEEFKKEKLFTTKTKHFTIEAHRYLGEYFTPTLKGILNISNDRTD